MEIYKNAPQTITLSVPAGINADGGEISIIAYENGVEEYEFENVTRTSEGYEVSLPWVLTRHDRDFDVRFVFTYTEGGRTYEVDETIFVQVVTPILPLEEVARIGKYDLATVEGNLDTVDLEHRVRYAIQTYTGQNFGKYRDTLEVTGNGTGRLPLPAPLLDLDASSVGVSTIQIMNGGWYVGTRNSRDYAIGPWSLSDTDTAYYSGAPIVLHDHKHLFRTDTAYRITGTWGYNDVPADVKQAARMLAADYSCDESLWRERYIDSVRSGNWRFEVNERTFAGTGNVVADQILLRYRNLTLAMI